jgi:hypothetical protein
LVYSVVGQIILGQNLFILDWFCVVGLTFRWIWDGALCILALGDFPYFIALVAGGLGISPS